MGDKEQYSVGYRASPVAHALFVVGTFTELLEQSNRNLRDMGAIEY
ncbi:hypothetical protein [Paenibacillus sp. PCH8]|nr:hypothetical protein [Paenibacillus sp. PCH8]